MKRDAKLGALLDAFVSEVAHPRGRVLMFLSNASVTVDQSILMKIALLVPDSSPSDLAATMNLSPSSISQMIERLVKLGLLRRAEHPEDRRRRTIHVTPKAKTLLAQLKAVRCDEYAAGTAGLSSVTRKRLAVVLADALRELPEQRR